MTEDVEGVWQAASGRVDCGHRPAGGAENACDGHEEPPEPLLARRGCGNGLRILA